MIYVSLLAIFLNFTCFLLYCAILILFCTQEHFHLVEDISLKTANIIFDKATRKVIKDAVKHARLMSAALYCSHVLYHSF
jgi:hypothetical protein